MELEVGVRITRDIGDLTFASTETEAVFILAAHLPGFTKDEIEVAMKEGNSQIIIRGGGHIAFQGAVITSRVAITREVSIECFDESFPVPDSVDLDAIDAWFDEEEKILIISIPKLLTNECSRMGEEETVEHPIQEERQVCKELVRGQTQEPTEEKNGESDLQGLTRPHRVKQQQAPAEIPRLPPMPGELIRHSPAEEKQQTGAADAKNKISALPKYPESEYSQTMQVAAERLDQEEQDDEAARKHITPKVKRPMQNEVKMTALEDDINASEKVCAAPTEFKKPTEMTEAGTPRIAEYSGSEEPNIEFSPSKKEAQEHKIPRINKEHDTPEQCPEQKQEQTIHEEQKIPTMKPMDAEHAAMELPKPREPSHVVEEVQQKCKTHDVSEPENSEPPKVKGTVEQLYPQQEEEEEQNQKKPRVKEPDQVQETKQQTESKEEYEDVHTQKPEVKTADEVLEAELFETKNEEREIPMEQDEEKLHGEPAHEKPTSAEWPETRKPEIELQGTKEDEKHILTGTDIEKRLSIETKEGSQDDHKNDEKIRQCIEKPTEKPSQLAKEEEKQQKSKEKAEKEMHQQEEEWLQEKKNHKEELPHEKPKTENLPEPRELHQQDGKPQLEITDQVMETKHPTKSQETEKDIQNQEQEHDKAATVQKKDKKSKDVGLPDKELRSLHGFKDDEAGQLKCPDIEAFRAREQLKPKDLSLDLHKQKTEKPTLKVPKETREAAEPTKTEKEEKVEPEKRQPEEQEAKEQKMSIGLSSETMKFQSPKELGKKHKQDRVSAPEQVLEAAQDIQSETEEELKQYEHEGQEDTEPIVVPAFEKPKAAELPQTKEPKRWVYEFYEDEDHQWIGPYEKPGESMHVEAEMQLKPPGETKAQETASSAVGSQLPGKPTGAPSEQESQTKQVEQATDYSIPRIQQTESKQTKKHERPLRQFIEDESKDQPEQQFKQPDEEEAQKRASPPEQELARNGETLEPPDRTARTNAVVEPEHDETTLEPPKPLPGVRETMETGSPPLPTMEKEATEPTITPPRIRGPIEPEGSPLLPSSDEETIKREFPTLIQKEWHPGSDLQNAEEQKTASRQMPEFEESAEEQEGKTKEPPPPHRAQEEIERPTEDVLHKILEVPQPKKICEREFKIYAPKELEEEQELNPALPLDHDKITLEEEVSSDEVEASCVEMDKSTNVTKLSSRRFHRRCRGQRPAYPIPPSNLLSCSAFVFSIMVLVFHFIKRKKSN